MLAQWLLGALLVQPAAAAEAPAPAVVELFTSQGCSSCPPAEQLLLDLEQAQPVAGVEIIPLAFHVDYWDRLGWRDPWAQAAFTRRQYAYARARHSERVYTPQALVNGVADVVGHDRARILAALKPLGRLDLSLEKGRLRIRGLRTGAPLFVAWTRDGLSQAVPRGENSGRKLIGHGVVLGLEEVQAQDGGAGLAIPKKIEATHAVAFQQAALGPIVSAGRLRLATRPPGEP